MTHSPETTTTSTEHDADNIEAEKHAWMQDQLTVLTKYFTGERAIKQLDTLNEYYNDKRDEVLDSHELLPAGFGADGVDRGAYEEDVVAIMDEMGLSREDAEWECAHRRADEVADAAVTERIANDIVPGKLGEDASEAEKQELTTALVAVAEMDEKLWHDQTDDDGKVVQQGWGSVFIDMQHEDDGETVDTADTVVATGSVGRIGKARTWAKDRFGRARHGANSALVLAGTKYQTGMQRLGSKYPTPDRKAGETDEQFEKRQRRYGAAKAVGAVALIAGGILLARNHGNVDIDMPDLFDGANDDSLSGPVQVPDDAEWNLDRTEVTGIAPESPADGDGGASGGEADPGDAEQTAEFSQAAEDIEDGEGLYQTFNELNLPLNATQKHEFLHIVGPGLVDMGLAYPAPELGGYGLNMTPDGTFPEDGLRYIVDTARDNGYLPEASPAEAVEAVADQVDETAKLEAEKQERIQDLIDKVPGATSEPYVAGVEVDGVSESGSGGVVASSDGIDGSNYGRTEDIDGVAAAGPLFLAGVGVGAGGSVAVRKAVSSHRDRSAEKAERPAGPSSGYVPNKDKLSEWGVTGDQWRVFVRDIAPTMRNLKYADGTPVAERVGFGRGWRFNASQNGDVHPLISQALQTAKSKRGWKK